MSGKEEFPIPVGFEIRPELYTIDDLISLLDDTIEEIKKMKSSGVNNIKVDFSKVDSTKASVFFTPHS